MNITYKDIFGFCDFYDVYKTIADGLTDGDSIVEVGAMVGHSTAYMATLLQNQEKNVNFYVVDLWNDVGIPNESEILIKMFGPSYSELIKNDPNIFYKTFLKNMADTGTLHKIIPLKLSSVEAAELIPDNTLSFCFIDAFHTYEAVKADITAWRPKIVSGGILAGHDYYWDGVRRAVDEAFPDRKLIGSSAWLTTL